MVECGRIPSIGAKRKGEVAMEAQTVMDIWEEWSCSRPVEVLKLASVLQAAHPWEELCLYYNIFQWKTLASWKIFLSSATSLNGRLASDGRSGVRTYSQGPSGHQSYDTRAAQWSLYSQWRQPSNLEVQRFYLKIICRDSSCPIASSGLCFALLQYRFFLIHCNHNVSEWW